MLRRSPSRRSQEIQVNRKGQVKVSVPLNAKEDMIHRFINDKARWIIEKVAQMRREQEVLNQKKFAHGHEFLFLGQKHKVVVHQHDRVRPQIDFDGQNWHVYLRGGLEAENPQAAIKKLLIKWYKTQSQEILGGRIFHYARQVGVTPKKIAVRTQKRVWGNCYYHTKTINLNWQIILSPLKVIDYVVVHELCHLIFPNHSRRFWQKVQKVFPDFKEAKRWLRVNALDMILPSV